MANKKDTPYSPENNKVTVYLEKNWKHYDSLNKIKQDGGNVSKTFVDAYEKSLENIDERILLIVRREILKNNIIINNTIDGFPIRDYKKE